MANKMQEKFQQVAKSNTNEQADRWVSASSQRHQNNVADTTESSLASEYHIGVMGSGRPTVSMSHNNELPPGYHIDKQHGHNGKWTGLNLAGSTDVCNCVTPESLANGFVKNPMSPVEDMYTDEHRDDFYDDVGGFVERANYLDRL